MIDLLLEPWQWGAWMWRGVVASLLVAVPAAVLGVFLYLRRMSMLADALSHIALPGIVAMFLLTGSVEGPIMVAGATLAGVLASLLIERLARHPNVRPDAAIGIVFTTLFALGVVLLSVFVHDAHIDTDCVVFGNVLAISDTTLLTLAAVAPLVLGGVAVFWRWLGVTSFDPALARNLGIPVAAVQYGLMTAVSVTTVASFEAVGAILVIALLVLPAATAHMFASSLTRMVAIAVAHAVTSCMVGMYVAVWLNCSPAGAIVTVGGVLYLLAFTFAPQYGAFWKYVSSTG